MNERLLFDSDISDIPHKKRAEIFGRHVTNIVIETHSYCNRVCSFCPNSFIDRRSFNTEFPEDVYLRILEELAAAKYRGVISFSRYQEPLSEAKLIYKRVIQIKQTVPAASVRFNTNGDYVTDEVLRRLAAVGVNSLSIQLYSDPENNRDAAKKVYEKLCRRAPLLAKGEASFAGKRTIKFSRRVDKMAITIQWRDFSANGTNRADLEVSNLEVRTLPCKTPVRSTVHVDYTGDVMPCCNLRSDYAPHSDLVLGNVRDDSLVDIFFSDKARSFRRSLIGSAPKKYPCATCRFQENGADAEALVKKWGMKNGE
jgi:radical SAM protein with 4Fe4S-binding SPASM domain